MLLPQLELLGHIGDHEGLADSLPAGDAEGAVAVGVLAIALLDEGLARNLFHGAQHRLVADPASPQGELKHHLFRRRLPQDHFDLTHLSTKLICVESVPSPEPHSAHSPAIPRRTLDSKGH